MTYAPPAEVFSDAIDKQASVYEVSMGGKSTIVASAHYEDPISYRDGDRVTAYAQRYRHASDQAGTSFATRYVFSLGFSDRLVTFGVREADGLLIREVSPLVNSDGTRMSGSPGIPKVIKSELDSLVACINKPTEALVEELTTLDKAEHTAFSASRVEVACALAVLKGRGI